MDTARRRARRARGGPAWLAYVRRASSARPASVRPARPARLLPTRPPAYPLKVGPTGRYLVDRNGRPFLIVGDSPQALIANVSETQADRYLRQPAGGRIQLGVDQPSLQRLHGRSPRWHDLRRHRPVHQARRPVHAESRLLRACRRHDPPRGQASARGVPRPDRDRGLAQGPAKQRHGEGLRLRSLPGPAVQAGPEHRLAQRQRLPDLAPTGGRCCGAGRRQGHPSPPIHARCKRSSSTT